MPNGESESEVLKQLKEQNAILTEQISLFTNQKNLAKLFFPTLPEGLEGSFELKGDFAVEGTAAAYESLKLIAQQWVDHIEGKLTNDDIQRVAEFRCREVEQRGEHRKCVQRQTAELRALVLNGSLEKVTILGQQEINGLLGLQSFMAKLSQLDSRLKAVIPEDKKIEVAVIPLAMIGAAVEAAIAVAGLFKKNVEITTTSVEVDEIALVAAVSEELRFRKTSTTLVYPAGFPPNLLDDKSALLDLLGEINRKMERLVRMIAELEVSKSNSDATVESAQADIKRLDAQITFLVGRIERLKNAGGPAAEIERLELELKKAREDKAGAEQRKAQGDRESKLLADRLKSLKQLRDVVDGFRNSLLAEDSAGASALTTLLKMEKIRADLSSKPTPVMQVKLHRAGASTKSKTTFFGGTKVSVGGGAVASFVLFKPDGEIAVSGVFTAKQKMKPLDDN